MAGDGKAEIRLNGSSFFGAISYIFDVGYGVGKAGLDDFTTDMAAELKPFGVQAITLVSTEVTSISRW